MRIGCFALIEPFTNMRRQFQAIKEMGFDDADLTDSHDGACLGVEFGFTSSVSLDSHPSQVSDLLEDTGLNLTAVCAHANLLDPVSPTTYSTFQIIKAIKLAQALGVQQVITTEGEASTDFGRSLTHEQRLFAIAERLYWPIRWAEHFGIELLIEPHGIVTDSVESTAELLDMLGHPETVGINLDTGNAWLGGAEPMGFVERFGDRIRHVHWKDMPAEMRPARGTMFGCGMATIALGDGVVGIKDIAQELTRIGFDGPTTLEVAGTQAVKDSAHRLKEWTS